MRILILAILPYLLGGCVVGTIASTAVDIATLRSRSPLPGRAATPASRSRRESRPQVRRRGSRGQALAAVEADCRKAKARGDLCPPRPSSDIR